MGLDIGHWSEQIIRLDGNVWQVLHDGETNKALETLEF